jgi:2-hydroxy-3-keto-5-methylthiopentenyl-1-phosphate phosphatase
MTIRVFVDFDGTITREDVGNAFFRTFGGEQCQKIVNEYRSGRLTATECFRRELATIGRLDKRCADEFVRAQAIDSGFAEFVRFCSNQAIEVYVLSDGLDYYIHEILDAHRIAGVRIFSNGLVFEGPDENGTFALDIRFPYTDAECTRCACCKRNIMLTRSGDDDLIVYVGEGYSDRCPARYADVVFAKGELQTYCREENISYFPYSSFAEVIVRMKQLTGNKRFRRPRQAVLRRREVFMAE